MRLFLLLAILSVPAAFLMVSTRPADPDPSPDLSAEAVVRIQVAALQRNDDPTPDAGIEAAFRFASPSNREATGPIDRFREMIRLGYADLLGFEEATYGAMRVAGDEAAQVVTLVQSDGQRSAYVFMLSRQTSGVYAGCWMTDAVVRHPVPPSETDGMLKA